MDKPTDLYTTNNNSSLPYYYRSLDWDRFVAKYPPPKEYAEDMYFWSREKIDRLKNKRFLEVVEHAWQVPFYKKRWTEAGLQPADIKSIADIEKIPSFTVDDLRESLQEAPPFGLHQGLSLEDAAWTPIKIQSSGGTTGTPRPTFFTPHEWELQAIGMARALYLHGARPGDICQIPATLSLANIGWAYFNACHHWLGVLPLTTGSGNVTPSRRQLELAKEWGTNIWGSFPEYLMRLASVAKEEGFDLGAFKTKFLSTYLGPDLQGHLRRQLEEAWQTEVYDNYGTHEVGHTSSECQHKNGLHLFEDLVHFEIVDTDSLEPVPTGQAGDVIATSLYRNYPPMIRYNLKDRTRLLPIERCECGSWMQKHDYFLGRSDDMVKLRGTNVYPMACLDAVLSNPATNGEWLCVVERIRRGIEFRDEMTVKIEYKGGNWDLSDVRRDLEGRLKNDLGVRVGVEMVPEGELKGIAYGTEGKAKRLLDKRFDKA